MENYNRYNESLNIDCGCGNNTAKVKKVAALRFQKTKKR